MRKLHVSTSKLYCARLMNLYLCLGRYLLLPSLQLTQNVCLVAALALSFDFTVHYQSSIIRKAKHHSSLTIAQGDAMWQTKLAEGGKTLVLTVWADKTQLLTVEQASQLTLPEFGKLWKVGPAVLLLE